MKEATETERNIAAALALRFESTLLQIMKRTRDEGGQVNGELNNAVSELLKQLDVYAHMGSDEEKKYSVSKTKSLTEILNAPLRALNQEMGIERPGK